MSADSGPYRPVPANIWFVSTNIDRYFSYADWFLQIPALRVFSGKKLKKSKFNKRCKHFYLHRRADSIGHSLDTFRPDSGWICPSDFYLKVRASTQESSNEEEKRKENRREERATTCINEREKKCRVPVLCTVAWKDGKEGLHNLPLDCLVACAKQPHV